jgi:ABC-type oligopeptide transport system substrate-binding subunit
MKETKIETHGIIREHNVQKDDKFRVQKASHDDVTKVKVKQEEKFEINLKLEDSKSMQSESSVYLALFSHFVFSSTADTRRVAMWI